MFNERVSLVSESIYFLYSLNDNYVVDYCCWLFIYQRFAQICPFCLYQTSSKLYESSRSHLSHTYWLICCFWYYRSFYFSWTSFVQVWHFFLCSVLDQILFTKRSYCMPILKTLNHLYSNSVLQGSVVSPLLLILYTLLSVGLLSYLLQQQTITSMLMILNFYHFQLWISLLTSLTLKAQQLTYPTGYHPTFCLLTLLKLIFSSLVQLNNSPNSIILPFIYLTISYSRL